MKYKIAYQFDRSGGNIQYKVKNRVTRVLDECDSTTLLSTGLSRTSDATIGEAYIEIPEEMAVEEEFVTAETIERVETVGSGSGEGQTSQRETATEKAGAPDVGLGQFSPNDDAEELLERVNRPMGGGFLLNPDFTPCDPFSLDQWFAVRKSYMTEVEPALTKDHLRSFYREHTDAFETGIDAYLVAYRGPTSRTVTLSIACACSKSKLMASSQHGIMWSRVSNLHRFELSKAALAVGAETHGPGHVDAYFKNDAGKVLTSRALAYHDWWGNMTVHQHPLGLLVDSELYRPATAKTGVREYVGNPVQLTTHRGATTTPWQFGLTRTDNEVLLTMARAGPKKFDPVLKRFEIEESVLNDEPLIVSSTVNRRLWKEDPTNPAVTSSRSEGEQVWLLYRNATGWHLAQPDPSEGFPDAGDDTSFAETDIPGVAVQSTGVRAADDGDKKSTIEREYRLRAPFAENHIAAYVLVSHEREEESIETLTWEITDATAYELQPDSSNNISELADVETPDAIPREEYVEAVQATREFIHDNNGATKNEVLTAFEPEHNYPVGHNGIAAQAKGFVPQFRDRWWDDVVRGLTALSDVTATDQQREHWESSIDATNSQQS